MSRQCQEDRLTNPHAMDIYDIDPGQAQVTQSTLQLNLLQVEGETSAGKSETSWLALGLKLQEAQCISLSADLYYLTFHRLALRTFICQKGSVLTVAERVQIATKWQNLDTQLDSFRAQAGQFVNDDTLDALQILNDLLPTQVPTLQPDYRTDSQEEDESNNPFITQPPLALLHMAETRPLPLPSTFGFPEITCLGQESLAKKELSLREGQANDQLQGVRIALGKKSFLFRKDLCLAESKFKKGRAWSKVHAVSQWVQAHHQVYNSVRAAMVALQCTIDMQTKYQVLHQDQLRISTAVVRSGTSSAESGSW